MASTDRAALGRFVLRTKEYLVLDPRPRRPRSRSRTLRFHDEVRPTKGIDTGGRKPAKAQLDAATKLIEALGVDWDPERYHDCYRERLLRRHRAQAQGARRSRRRRRAATPAARRRTSWTR